MKSVPSAAGRTLQLQCTLNLMSCYLKSGMLEECVNEGSEVCLRLSTHYTNIICGHGYTSQCYHYLKCDLLSLFLFATFAVSSIYELSKWKSITLSISVC